MCRLRREIIGSFVIKTICIFILFFVIIPRGWGRGNAVVSGINQAQTQLAQGDYSALLDISIDELRQANDDDKGTLLAAGLIYFFDNKIERAILAFTRSARTGVEPYATEAARALSVTLARAKRYPQISEILNSLYKGKKIVDTEIAYYYTLSLLLKKDYQTLASLVSSAHDFSPTLRNRISPQELMDLYASSRAIVALAEQGAISSNLRGSKSKQNSLAAASASMRDFLLTLPARNLSGDMIAVLDLIFEQLTTLPNYKDDYASVHELYTIKKFLSNKQQEHMPRILAFIGQEGIASLLDDLNHFVFSTNLKKTRIDEIRRVFTEFQTHDDIFVQSLAHAFLARDYYRREKFTSARIAAGTSLDTYQAYTSSNPELSPFQLTFMQRIEEEYNYRNRRIEAFGTIQTKPSQFAKLYQTYKANDADWYDTTLLEEFGSRMIRSSQTKTLGDAFEQFALSSLNNLELQILDEWSILLEALKYSSSSLDAYARGVWASRTDIQIRSESWYPALIRGDEFPRLIAQITNTANPASTHQTNTNDLDAELFVSLYLSYGLKDYASRIALENSNTISSDLLDDLHKEICKPSEVSLRESCIRLFELSRKRLFNGVNTIVSVSDLSQLYPLLYKEYLDKIDTDPLNQSRILAVIRQESSYKPFARSPAGALGLMQLIPATARDIVDRIVPTTSPYDLFDPRDNIRLGAQYLAYLKRVLDAEPPRASYASLVKTLAAYNAGIGKLLSWQTQKQSIALLVASLPVIETRNYVKKVLSSIALYLILYYDVAPDQVYPLMFGGRYDF